MKKRLFFVSLVLAFAVVVFAAFATSNPASALECRWHEVGFGSEMIHESWPAGPPEGACLAVEFVEEGQFEVTGGWVFTAPLSLNGQVIETVIITGQIAPQIVPLVLEVVTGQVAILEPTWLESGTEIGLWYNYTPEPEPPGHKVYFPSVFSPVVDLIEIRTLAWSPGLLQVTTASWPNAIPGQRTCLQVDFAGSGNAFLESGWFFGDWDRAELNGTAISIPTIVTNPPQASQIGSASLPNAETLKVCVKAQQGVWPEIGLRIRFPG